MPRVFPGRAGYLSKLLCAKQSRGFKDHKLDKWELSGKMITEPIFTNVSPFIVLKCTLKRVGFFKLLIPINCQ